MVAVESMGGWNGRKILRKVRAEGAGGRNGWNVREEGTDGKNGWNVRVEGTGGRYGLRMNGTKGIINVDGTDCRRTSERAVNKESGKGKRYA